jgi:hypothetical protein
VKPIPPGVRDFLAGRSSFYFATRGETGWYRAAIGDATSGSTCEIRGPTGLLRVLDDDTVGWADLSGNLRHMRTENMDSERGAALFATDYPIGQHVTIFGRAHLVPVDDVPELIDSLPGLDGAGNVKHGVVVTVDTVDWKQPIHRRTHRLAITAEIEESAETGSDPVLARRACHRLFLHN